MRFIRTMFLIASLLIACHIQVAFAVPKADVAGPLTEIVLLGNVAMRYPGKRLQYDGENMKVTNVAEANRHIKRNYEGGWTL